MKKIIELAKSTHEPTAEDMERVFSKVITAAAAPAPAPTIALGKSFVFTIVAAATVAIVSAKHETPASLPAAEPPVVSTPARAVFVPAKAPGSAPVLAPAPIKKQYTFADELALIERARAEDPTRALATLELHQKRFGAGVLNEEARGLRVRALCALGDRDRAVALGRVFLAEHPRAPLAETVRNCLARFP